MRQMKVKNASQRWGTRMAGFSQITVHTTSISAAITAAAT